MIDVVLPDVGDVADVEIVEILVQVGDTISAEQPLLVVESDKATIEIPAPAAAVVQELIVTAGQRVSKGDLLMRTTPADGVAAAPAPLVTPPAAPISSPPFDKGGQGGFLGATGQGGFPAAPAPTAAPASPLAPIEICLPDIGDIKRVPIIEVQIRPGDVVNAEQPLLILETDKTTLEVPTPLAGLVQHVWVQVGDQVGYGDRLLTLLPTATEELPVNSLFAHDDKTLHPPTTAALAGESRKAPVLPRPADLAAIAPGQLPHASPSVRRFARELGVDLTQVTGTGPKSRIVKEDVQTFVKQRLATAAAPAAATSSSATAPTVTSSPVAPVAPASPPFDKGGQGGFAPTLTAADFAKFGPVETQPLARVRRVSGAHLHRSWTTVPHVTQFDAADITDLEAFRTSQQVTAAGVKLTLLPFVLKAVATALARMPLLKASLIDNGEQVVLKQYCHIGVAVDTPNGLVVPVVRDVDHKGLLALATELAALSAKARDGKLAPSDLQGGVFSISSLGGIGGTAFTPIVNAPEVAVLGVSRATTQPVWDATSKQFVPRLQLPLSLSYDHRVVDGADGVRFTTLLTQLLGDMRQLLL
nr:dihydrolipoyllysine-residue acetyltransferase [Thiospirillum jenense]